ncbi:hypothetical protein JCM8097_001396 [Rhodosporidiobolus ruineniae]
MPIEQPPARFTGEENWLSESEEDEVEEANKARPTLAAPISPDIGVPSPSSPLPLPPELILHILHIDDYEYCLRDHDLAACALVSRAMLPLARKILYRKLGLWFERCDATPHPQDVPRSAILVEQPLRRLWLTLRRHEHLLEFVDDLTVDVDEGFGTFHIVIERPHPVAAFPRLLAGMVNLESLVFKFTTHARTENLFLQHSPMHNLTTLHILHLAPETVAFLPALRTLRTTLPPSCDTLNPIDAGFPSPANLRTLELGRSLLTDPSLAYFNWLTAASLHTLTSFSTPYNFFAPLHPHRLPFRPDLTHFTALRSLELVVPPHRPMRVPTGPDAFPDYPSTLEHLSLVGVWYGEMSQDDEDTYGLESLSSWTAFYTSRNQLPYSLRSLELSGPAVEPVALLAFLHRGQLPVLHELTLRRMRQDWDALGSGAWEGKTMQQLDVLKSMCSSRGICLSLYR